MLPPNVTPRQNEILQCIVDYTEKHGFGPSFAEIAEECGYAHRSAVHYPITRLEAAGVLERLGNRRYVVIGKRDAADHLRSVLNVIAGSKFDKTPAVLEALRFMAPA